MNSSHPAEPISRRAAAVGGGRVGRILMLTTSLEEGGAEEQVVQLSLGLHERRWRVRIVTLIPPPREFPALAAAGIGIGSLGMRPGIADPRGLLRLAKELRDFNPDVVHCHMPQASLLARALRPFHAIPVVISTLHNVTMERVNGSSGRFLEVAHGLTDRFADLTTVICGAGLRYYVDRRVASEGKISVVYNGVNTSAYQPDPEARGRMRAELGVDGNFVWLAAGRFTLAKAYPQMLRAYAKVLQRNSRPSMLVICGDGPLRTEIRALIQELGIANHVRLLGVRRDIPQLMNAADAFVMSSRLEGLPLVLLEASATGLPIVTTSVGGNAEVVVDRETGFVVPPEDPEALAVAMERMMTLAGSERAAMAEAGRRFTIGRFDMKNVLDEWERIYGDLLQRKMRRPSAG